MTRELPDRLRDLYATHPMVMDAADEIERLDEELRQADKNVCEAFEQLIKARAEVDSLAEAHERIVDWSRAYPLTNGGMTLDALSADAMRHVIEGVGKISRAALEHKP